MKIEKFVERLIKENIEAMNTFQAYSKEPCDFYDQKADARYDTLSAVYLTLLFTDQITDDQYRMIRDTTRVIRDYNTKY